MCNNVLKRTVKHSGVIYVIKQLIKHPLNKNYFLNWSSTHCAPFSPLHLCGGVVVQPSGGGGGGVRADSAYFMLIKTQHLWACVCNLTG